MKIKKLNIIVAILASTTLTACVTKGGTSSSSLKPTVQTVADTSVIQNNVPITMPIFKVNFQKRFDARARQESGNWRSNSSVSQTVVVDIEGINENVLQDITNQAYQDLLARLSAKQIKVTPIEQAYNNSKALRDASANTDFPEVAEEESTYLASKTMYPSGFLDSMQDRLTFPPGDVFKELKGNILAVNYTVDYLASKAETDAISGWNSETLAVEISLSPAASVSGQMQVFAFPKEGCPSIGVCSGPSTTVSLNQRAISTIEFGELKNTTSTGSQVAQGAVKMLGFLMGSKSSSSFDNYTLSVDEANFVSASVDALKKANQKIADQF